VDIGAAAFLGFHAQAGAEVSCKVMRKREPSEQVGVVARVDGRVGVVEYTEIDEARRNARDASGELLYWAGNMAIHVFDCDLVRRVAEQASQWLPYHRSKKKLSTIDAGGRPLQPEEPNGYKLERFVFDALAATDRACVVEALRRDEYSPVKNAEGSESPRTARRDLVARYRAWLEGAGIQLPPPGVAIEVDESLVGGPEDARALGIRRIEEAGDVIRVRGKPVRSGPPPRRLPGRSPSRGRKRRRSPPAEGRPRRRPQPGRRRRRNPGLRRRRQGSPRPRRRQ
jgi:hypothetical protein